MLLRTIEVDPASEIAFQWAPTLGGECYGRTLSAMFRYRAMECFNGHPPLGVNATQAPETVARALFPRAFQWAPTLGGECYTTLLIPGMKFST